LSGDRRDASGVPPGSRCAADAIDNVADAIDNVADAIDNVADAIDNGREIVLRRGCNRRRSARCVAVSN
jgi:hypothetical protein